jgi:hypothetical protein
MPYISIDVIHDVNCFVSRLSHITAKKLRSKGNLYGNRWEVKSWRSKNFKLWFMMKIITGNYKINFIAYFRKNLANNFFREDRA